MGILLAGMFFVGIQLPKVWLCERV